jgi:hypothetical protein
MIFEHYPESMNNVTRKEVAVELGASAACLQRNLATGWAPGSLESGENPNFQENFGGGGGN